MQRWRIPKVMGNRGGAAGALRMAQWVAALGLALPLAACQQDQPEPQLPDLGAATEAVTVSGISSGAYMATQFQFAHASRVSGAGIVAGGPYGCAESLIAPTMPMPGAALLNLTKAINGCMHHAMQFLGEPNVARLADQATRRGEEGDNDPISDVVPDRVYLFSGVEDRTVAPAIVAAARELYEAVGVAPERIIMKSDVAAGHGFVTLAAGGDCAATGAPFLNDCDYDQAGAILSHLLGNLTNPSAPPAENSRPLNELQGLRLFDQSQFTQDLENHGLARKGFVYVPQSCEGPRAATCRVHVVFHGCKQAREILGTAFVSQAGYNRWAQTNDLIVLYPQVANSPVNPQGCWDWWGYTGRDYLTKAGPQILAVKRMLDRLAGIGRDARND